MLPLLPQHPSPHPGAWGTGWGMRDTVAHAEAHVCTPVPPINIPSTPHPPHHSTGSNPASLWLTQGCCYGEHGCKPGHLLPFPSTGSQPGSWGSISRYQTVSGQGKGTPAQPWEHGSPHQQPYRIHSPRWGGGRRGGEWKIRRGRMEVWRAEISLSSPSSFAGWQRGARDLRSDHPPCESPCLACLCFPSQGHPALGGDRSGKHG